MMDQLELKINTRLWIWDGPSSWYFITIPERESTRIKKTFGAYHRGFGSIPVKAQIGTSKWKTSIFWEKKETYILPVKKEIRKNEDITNGSRVTLHLFIENVT